MLLHKTSIRRFLNGEQSESITYLHKSLNRLQRTDMEKNDFTLG